MPQIIYKGTKDYYPEFKPHTGIQETDSPTLTMNITDLYPGTEYTLACEQAFGRAGNCYFFPKKEPRACSQAKYTFVVRAENHCVYGGNSSMAQGSTKVDGKLFTVCFCVCFVLCPLMVDSLHLPLFPL